MSRLNSDEQRISELIAIAKALTTPGKGILASDESPSTIGKRLEKAGVENTAENRRQYRELFYTANGIGDGISGAIVFPEALTQCASDGTSFVDALNSRGVLVGVKVDQGLQKIEQSNETVTRGLEGLEDRCKEYRAAGARFAKWRAALKVPPSPTAIDKNASQLAEYAYVCQKTGLVPIVEPELLIDGDHDADAAVAATELVINACIAHLLQRSVVLEAILLKPQMIIPGIEWNGPRPGSKEVAHRTLRVLSRCVPAGVPGIMFLSGGQSEEEATRNLNELNLEKMRNFADTAPWALSFSFGRALQASVLTLWTERKATVDDCKAMATALATVNGRATLGLFTEDSIHPSITSRDGSLHENFRGVY